MREVSVRPGRIRGMGNVVPPLSTSDLSINHCVISSNDDFMVNGVGFIVLVLVFLLFLLI